jgi:hypothetical protein
MRLIAAAVLAASLVHPIALRVVAADAGVNAGRAALGCNRIVYSGASYGS